MLHIFGMAFKCFFSGVLQAYVASVLAIFGRILQVFYLGVVKVELVLHMLQWDPPSGMGPLLEHRRAGVDGRVRNECRHEGPRSGAREKQAAQAAFLLCAWHRPTLAIWIGRPDASKFGKNGVASSERDGGRNTSM